MNKSTQILSDVSIWSKYARYFPEITRREVFSETTARYENMMAAKYPHIEELIRETMVNVVNHVALPSMRGMQFAGPAIASNESRVYNCAYTPIQDEKAFSETMFLLLGGTGLGYSVQGRHISQSSVLRFGHSGTGPEILTGELPLSTQKLPLS